MRTSRDRSSGRSALSTTLWAYAFLEKACDKRDGDRAAKDGLACSSASVDHHPLRGVHLGEYYADLLVADAVIGEIKAVQKLIERHEAQLLNYLKATSYEVGLPLHFGPKPDLKHKIYDNDKKGFPTWNPRALRPDPATDQERPVKMRENPCPIPPGVRG